MEALKSRRSTDAERADYAEVLASIFEFMLMSGSKKASILETVGRALENAEKVHNDPRSRHQEGLVTAALVLDAWHRNRRYLDAEAKPKAIPLLGAAPSVEALVRAEQSSVDAAATARRLRSLSLVLRAGKNLYKPADRYAVISKLDPLVQQHVARSSSNLLRTIKNNVSRPQSSHRLIERFAEVPDLPLVCKKEFRQFTKAQGWAFLKTMNDWLESRRARRTPKKSIRTLRAGVHLYAYFGPTENL
jgi:hypothetical protein